MEDHIRPSQVLIPDLRCAGRNRLAEFMVGLVGQDYQVQKIGGGGLMWDVGS